MVAELPFASSAAALGAPIPYLNSHALSVSLPTWEDNVGWSSGDSCTVDAMSTGYPRFFVHRTIQNLASDCLKKAGMPNELCMLFPSARTANVCISYMSNYVDECAHTEIRVVNLTLGDPSQNSKTLELHAVLFPSQLWQFAKSCWQHSGIGISSRYAEACLALIAQNNRQYPVPKQSPIRPAVDEKLLIRERIASLVSFGDLVHPGDQCIRKRLPSEHDVFLYPTGMSAIWHTHQLTLTCKPGLKSVCFGFLYTDTMKILEKWGPGCYFYGHDPDTNLASFEAFLASSQPSLRGSGLSGTSPVSAVFCEFPSNPLLQSSNVLRLRQLADRYSFLICIDDTIGNSVNTELLDYADVIITSLSKSFSGKADVMGGSVVINPNSPHYDSMCAHMRSSFVDDYFGPDAIQMEMNSRDFAWRVNIINANTRAVCNFLRSRSLSFISSSPSGPLSGVASSPLVIKDVFYPEWITPTNYSTCRRPGKDNNFGPLFSMTFISHKASEAFYNALPCAKGPSLGTDFTLACPYTILAHFQEREWAAEYGVEEGIVRVSVGMEERETLMEWFRLSLEAAEKTASTSTK